MKRVLVLMAVLGACLVASAPALGTTIGTTGSWNGSSEGCCWGSPAEEETATYGQTILGTGENLQSFTFFLHGGGGVVFRPGVYAWTGSSAGGLVWEGGPMTVPNSANSGMVGVTATVDGPARLTAGDEYVLLFTTVGTGSPAGEGRWGLVTTNPYADGTAVYSNDGSSVLSAWDGNPWSPNYDFAFTAVFGPWTSCWNDLGTNGCNQLARTAVCINGAFHDIETRELSAQAYQDATLAVYVQGFGLTCALSNVANAGLDPGAFHDAGYKVDNTGARAPSIVTDVEFGAVYEFYAKSA